jgi:transcription initiation factor TFIIE subunit alpha
VVRAFYETRHILVVDALFIHSVLHAEDLAHLLGMQPKDLRKLCARLREDRLIAVHTRSEIRDGSTRPVNRDYYYIPLHPVVDAIKYRVSRLTSTIKAQYTPSADRKEYICLRCGAEWTELDVLSLYSDEGFECQHCGAVLERTEDVKGSDGIDRTGHEKNSKLMAQLDRMLKLLKQIDSVDIPQYDFETAWDHKIDVVRNQHTHQTRPSLAAPSAKQAAVRGNTRTDASAIEISLTSSAEKSAAEQTAEATRKAALEKQNALPVWHTHSTISTAPGSANRLKSEAIVDIKAESFKDEEEQKSDLDAFDDIATYYAEIARKKELEADEEASSAEEEDDDEENEFEDVGVSGTGTPAVVSTSGMAAVSPPITGVKRGLESQSSSSVSQTAAATPATPPDDGPATKKPKVCHDPKKDEESDEDDEVFENV